MKKRLKDSLTNDRINQLLILYEQLFYSFPDRKKKVILDCSEVITFTKKVQ